MRMEQYLANLAVPTGKADVVLDTDAYNEIDDQFAIAYLLGYGDRLTIKGICAAPFLNSKAETAAIGMEKSYDEIFKILTLSGREELRTIVYRGSKMFLSSETTPVESEAADFMAELANGYSPEHPLYIVAIGAISNVASAILKNPKMKENCVLIWLGGHALHMPHGVREFNMQQDIAGARVVFGCGIPLVQLPCFGVVDCFATSKYELQHWLQGKNVLCDYLYENTVREAESYAAGKPWTRVIWDVTAVAWLLNDRGQFMKDSLIPSPVPEYDGQYKTEKNRHMMRYVYHVDRDALFADLFRVLAQNG